MINSQSIFDKTASGTGLLIKPQFLKTIHEPFERSLQKQTFLSLADTVKTQKHMGNTINQNLVSKFAVTTRQLNSQFSDGETINEHNLTSRNIKFDYWTVGAFVKMTDWSIKIGDAEVEMEALKNISRNAVESLEMKAREFLVKGSPVYADKDIYSFSDGSPCSLWTGKSGTETSSTITTTNGVPSFGAMKEIVREIQLLGGGTPTILMSTWCADYLRTNDKDWREAMKYAYSQNTSNGNPFIGGLMVNYDGMTFKVMQDYIVTNLGSAETPKLVDNIFIIPKGAFRVNDTAKTFEVKVKGFTKNDVNDPYDFIKSMAWKSEFGAQVVDSSVIWKMSCMYDGMPASETIFDELNYVEEE